MHPLLLSADFDPFQVAIIVIAVLAGFVKWLWENWQQKMGAAPTTQAMSPEEQRMREAAWRKQTGQSAPPPPLPPVAAAPSAWDELRKAWKELQEAAKQSQVPTRPAPARRPPPIPAQRQNPIRREQQAPRHAAPVAAPPVATVLGGQKNLVPVTEVPATPAVMTSKATAPAGSTLAGLLNLRRDPALMRQAILMQEILGPPKALQSSHDLAI